MNAYSEFEKANNAIRELFMTIAEELGIPKVLDWLLKKLKSSKTIHLSRGLAVNVTETGKYLCLQPRLKDRSRTAWEIWVTHTEDRLKDRIAERLVTKGENDG